MKLAHCQSCEAPIIWTVTERGKRMPVNAEAVDVQHGFRLKGRENGGAPLARWGLAMAGEKLYVAHFATCPDAAQHRRPKRGASADR